MMKKCLSMVAAALFAAGGLAHAQCPPKEKVQSAVSHLFRKGVKVTGVHPSEVAGLCRVDITFRGRKQITYTDGEGKYLIAGQIFRVADKANITRNAIDQLNRFSKADMKKLDSLVAFTAGSGKATFYLVTDPQCPYCKRAEKIIDKMIEEGKITVKYLMFPLPFHKGAKEETISIICDNKGLDGFRHQYKSDNQCEAGKKKVEETIKFLRSKGINGTPTYIFENGLFHSGVIQRAELEKRLGIKGGKK